MDDGTRTSHNHTQLQVVPSSTTDRVMVHDTNAELSQMQCNRSAFTDVAISNSAQCDERMAIVPVESIDQSEQSTRQHQSTLNTAPGNQRKTITIKKLAAHFPPVDYRTAACWHLYAIQMGKGADLGFISPCELRKVPAFYLNSDDGQSLVQIRYIGPVDYSANKDQFEHFCRFIFEVCHDMHAGSTATLKFDVEASTFKPLPCFLTETGDVDYQRMASIYAGTSKFIQSPDKFSDAEDDPQTDTEDPPSSQQESDSGSAKRKCNQVKSSKRLNAASSFIGDGLPKSNNMPPNPRDADLISKLPRLLDRIVWLSHIEELRQRLADITASYTLVDVDNMPPITFTDCLASSFASSNALPPDLLCNDMLTRQSSGLQPSPALLFQAITRRSVDRTVNMKKLDAVGDAFLKLVTCLSLYYQYPFGKTGLLTSERDKQVSNAHLQQVAREKDLLNYINAVEPIFSGDGANWLPPGYVVQQGNEDKYTACVADEKAPADLVESLIGCYLVSTDYMTTIKFMHGLGLNVIPFDGQGGICSTPSILRPPKAKKVEATEISVMKLYDEHCLNEIEQSISYDFTNKAYLVSALTHSSSATQSLTTNQERLKFIGNALLEFLVKRTNQKNGANLLNKDRKANVAIAHKLHTHIFCDKRVSGHVRTYAAKGKTSIGEDEQSPSVKGRLALTKTFDALIGAVFFDAKHSFATVWTVAKTLLQTPIDHSIHGRNQPLTSEYFHYHTDHTTQEQRRNLQRSSTEELPS